MAGSFFIRSSISFIIAASVSLRCVLSESKSFAYSSASSGVSDRNSFTASSAEPNLPDAFILGESVNAADVEDIGNFTFAQDISAWRP